MINIQIQGKVAFALLALTLIAFSWAAYKLSRYGFIGCCGLVSAWFHARLDAEMHFQAKLAKYRKQALAAAKWTEPGIVPVVHEPVQEVVTNSHVSFRSLLEAQLVRLGFTMLKLRG